MKKIEDVMSVSLSQIDKMKYQPEERHEKVDKMAEDIQAHGLIYPVKLTPYIPRTDGNGVEETVGADALKDPRHRFLIVDGHRRVWAHESLGRAQIPALLELGKNYRQILRMWMTANSKRLNPNPYEMAKFVEHYTTVSLQELRKNAPNLSEAERARIVMNDLCDASGFSSTFFHSRLAILRAPKKIQKMIKEESSKGSLPTEVESNIPKRYQERVYQAYEKKELVSTLDPRPLGRQLKDIENDATLDDTVKVARANAVIETFRGGDKVKQAPSTVKVEKYHHDVDVLRRTILLWDLCGLSMGELDRLTTSLADLQATFRELRRQSGLLPKGK